MDDSNVTLITAMGKSKVKKEDQGLPWYSDEPAPTAEVVEEIVDRFHTYALLGKPGSENKEEFDRLGLTFKHCTGLVKKYFNDQAKQIDTEEARDIASEALELVDEFEGWFYPRGQFTKQNAISYMKIFKRWKNVSRRFNMCMNSGNQEEERAETKLDITPAKRRDSWTCIKKTLWIIGAIIGFLASLLTCLYYLGWL